MKTFHQYLTESKQVYEYRIKIAGDLDKDCIKSLEEKLAKFDVVKLSDAKKTPVVKSPAGFPHLENQEIHIMDATFNYPASEGEVVAMYEQCGGNPNHIRLIAKGHDDMANAVAEQAEESPILDEDLPETNKQQKEAKDDYAEANVIQNSAEGAEFEIAGGDTPAAETTNDLPTGDKSPITGDNELPDIKTRSGN